MVKGCFFYVRFWKDAKFEAVLIFLSQKARLFMANSCPESPLYFFNSSFANDSNRFV